jgi:molecular chaperone GrpE (heat shock protein)
MSDPSAPPPEEKNAGAPSAQHEAVDIDVTAVPALTVDLFKPKMPVVATGLMSEIADDLLSLMKMVQALDARTAALAANVERIGALQEQATRSQSMELEKTKEALLSDRKEYIARSTFSALRPALESLEYLREGAEERGEDPALIRQTQTLIDILRGVSQALGYQTLTAAPGDEFDPHTMECAGYSAGAAGKVVRIDKPGYRAGSVLVRPCSVILGMREPTQDERASNGRVPEDSSKQEGGTSQ